MPAIATCWGCAGETLCSLIFPNLSGHTTLKTLQRLANAGNSSRDRHAIQRIKPGKPSGAWLPTPYAVADVANRDGGKGPSSSPLLRLFACALSSRS